MNEARSVSSVMVAIVALSVGQPLGFAQESAVSRDLAWVSERFKIEKTYKQFEAAYDAKYAELIGELKGAL